MQENEVLKAVKGRRSVLRFEERPVSDEHIEAILEAGRWAPSYINSQPWEFVVIRDAERRRKASEILRRITLSWQGFAQAPVLILVAVSTTADPRHHLEDGAAAAQNMALMAHSLGVASFWAGIYGESDGRGTPEDELRSLLHIPRALRLVAALPIGYPAYAAESSRRPLLEMVHQESFRS
jgi:nitroreductase